MKRDYFERLTGETIEVTLPGSRKQAWQLYSDIMELATEDPEQWRTLVRMYTGTDLWMLALFLSWSRYVSPWTGRPAIDCDYQWDFCRAVMERCDHIVDYSPRGHAKSTWKTHTRLIQEVLRNPNLTTGIFSFEKLAAEKHHSKNIDELRTNVMLKAAWDDVLYADPVNDAEKWGKEGANVKRDIVSVSPTFAAYSFMSGLPIGSRLGLMVFDDVEDEKAVASDDMIAKLRDRFAAAQYLSGDGGQAWVSGTLHHPQALLGDLIDNKGWDGRCYPAEDPTKAPPDMRELFDSFGGYSPVTHEPLPQSYRRVEYAGHPVYLHPLELAKYKTDPEHSWKYEMQFLGKRTGSRSYGFREEWIRWYEQESNAVGAGRNIYILVDPTAGIKDPYVMLAMAILPNGNAALVDGARRCVPPARQDRDLVAMVHRWDSMGHVVQVRVEGYGQSTFDVSFRRALANDGLGHVKVVKCRDSTTSIGLVSQSGKRSGLSYARPWVRLQGPFSNGQIIFPRSLLVPDEKDGLYDLINYFMVEEYGRFPANSKDDFWAALCLLHDPSEEAGPLLVSPVDRDIDDFYPEDEYRNATTSWMSM